MIFPLTLLAAAGCTVWTHARERRSPLLPGLVAWLIGVALAAAPLLEFDVEYSLATDLFAAACLVAATTAYHLVRQPGRNDVASEPWNRPRENALARMVGYIGVAGCLMLLTEAAVRGVNFSITGLGESLASIREDAFRAGEEGSGGPLVFFGDFLMPCAYLYLVLATKLKLGRLLTITTVVLLTFVSLFYYGGRQPIVTALVLIGLSAWLLGWKLRVRPRTIVVGLVAFMGVWYSAVSFLSSRTENANPVALLDRVSHATYDDQVEQLARSNAGLGTALFSLSYFSSPMPSMTYYFNQTTPGPYYGGYSFPFPTLVLTVATGTAVPDRWNTTRREIFDVYEGRNYAGNVWATWLRDLRLDFGAIGATLFCAAFGGFMAWARNRYARTGQVGYHAMAALASLTFTFGAFANLLFVNYVAYAFFMAVALTFTARPYWAPAGVRLRRVGST